MASKRSQLTAVSAVVMWRYDSIVDMLLYLYSSLHTHKSRSGSRNESTVDLRGSSNHPLTRRSQRRPFLKRYTIADFANTRAYQESTASLISASAEHGLSSTHSTATM